MAKQKSTAVQPSANTLKKKGLMDYLKRDWQLYALMLLPMLFIIFFKYLAYTGLSGAFLDYNIGKGYAGRLIRHLFKLYRPRCRQMEVGTSPTMISFYEQFGFRPAYVRDGFFTDNYPEPIEENGEILTDMHVLSVEL